MARRSGSTWVIGQDTLYECIVFESNAKQTNSFNKAILSGRIGVTYITINFR